MLLPKSFLNAGCRAPLLFFRNNGKKQIDLLLEQDGILYPVEAKDACNLRVLDPVAAGDVLADLLAYKREIGCGCILCMAGDTFPVIERVWAFTVWSV